MDLTPRRSKLLSNAKNKDSCDPKIDFAFADINCRLGFKLKDGKFKFFNSLEEISQIWSSLIIHFMLFDFILRW